MTYTLREKLEQLRDTPAGGAYPAFFRSGFDYVADLQQLAVEVLAELDRLKKFEVLANRDIRRLWFRG